LSLALVVSGRWVARVPDEIEERQQTRPAERDLIVLPDGDSPPQAYRVERVRPGERHEAPHERDDGGNEDRADEPPPSPGRRRRRLLIIAIVAAILLLAAAGFGWYWFATLRWLESTDDAYTQADNTVISPKAAGYVAELRVTDNQVVKPGELLLRIDPRDYRAALAQAQADIASAEADIRNIEAQIAQQQSVIDQTRADIASAESALTFSQQENARYQELARTGFGTVQRAQQAAADLRDKTAALQHNRATLDAAQKQVVVLQTQLSKSQAALQHNQAALQQANLNLGYTEISSPIAGAVGNRTVQIGQYIQPGTQLMTIVPLEKNIYVIANFKETQIGRMFRGESVDITVDTFPGKHLHGVVDSLAPGSGAQFALLPPENATGNFTKIVQRVPVKILIDGGDEGLLQQLRPGLSVTATVDIRTAPPSGAQTLVLAQPGAK
jgi:membrane fusion protein (multidrug efflux system)